MKILNILLLSMALFLAFKPGIELLFLADSTEQSCCIDICSSIDAEDAHEKDDCHDDGCEGNFCNPFQVCGSCFVLIQNRPPAQELPLSIVSKRQFVYQFNASSSFNFEFWHPPRMA